MKSKLIGVIGAGVMGSGVAQNFASYGYQVILVDINKEALEKSEESIYNNIRLQALFSKQENAESANEVIKRINFTTELQSLSNVEIVIENIFENWEAKQALYVQLNDICSNECFYLVNTSCISVTQVASLLKNPERVIGTHFMNPVPMKSTIEVIRGYHTSESTIEVTKKLLATLNKECIIVNDLPGFVSNRISHLFMNEAAFVVQDQVASSFDVDEIFKKCYGHSMGPLETADLIGLDTVVNSLNVLYESYQDSKYRCCPLLKKMVDAGLLGRKSGKGFYEY
jgi:3-hydroxybutyryl-CoA dehydrogenase